MKRSNKTFEKHITICKNEQSIISALAEHFPELSKQKLKRTMQYGAVWLTPRSQSGYSKERSISNHAMKTIRIRRAKRQVFAGEQIHIYYNEQYLFSEIPSAKLVADEGLYSIWNKPCGMFSQGTKWGDHTSIARWIELFGLEKNQLTPRTTFLAHRLDRATNGLMVVAHTKKAVQRLAQLFEVGKIHKHYSAMVDGEYPTEPKFQQLCNDIDGKRARTIIMSSHYNVITNQTSLMLKIETGRKHQIRKHLSDSGYPVVGDRLYGNAKNNIETLPDLMLRSCFLEFQCPFEQVSKTYHLPAY